MIHDLETNIGSIRRKISSSSLSNESLRRKIGNIVVLGLGSNIGNREQNILEATRKLPLADKIASSLIKTKALLTKDAPEAWNMDYYNAVVVGRALFDPVETLIRLKKIEKQMKRVKMGKYSPRTIDIDILFWGNGIISKSYLRIPHKEVLNRSFTLRPLAEIAAFLLHPIFKVSIRQALLSHYRSVSGTSCMSIHDC